MVLPTLRGQKTATRWICSPQPETVPARIYFPVNDWLKVLDEKAIKGLEVIHATGPGKGMVFPKCKYGSAAGNILWVREKVRLISVSTGYSHAGVFKGETATFEYLADGTTITLDQWPERVKPVKVGQCISNGCFKELARIWIRTTEVSVVRLQEISWQDIQAEGLSTDLSGIDGIQDLEMKWKNLCVSKYGVALWNSNPWVYKIQYEVLSTTGRPELETELNSLCHEG